MPTFHTPDNGQRGETALILAMVVALGLGTAVYYGMDKTIQQQLEQTGLLARDRASQMNISALAQTALLMTYAKDNAAATDPTALPYIYPDPYLGNQEASAVGATRAAPGGVTTWKYVSPNLNLFAPSAGSAAAFASYVATDQRPALDQAVTVTFDKPLMDTYHTSWIRAYRIQATTQSGKTKLTSTATVPVAPMPPPACALTTLSGQTLFQPDAVIELSLAVAGVAQAAMVPTTAAQIAAGSLYGDTSGYKKVPLDTKAMTIRNTSLTKSVYAWKATVPRPLAAVDGTGVVPFTITAQLIPVDNSDMTKSTCSLTINVTAPANCKLFTDRASVSPGSCANLSYQTVGTVAANSFKLAAQDLSGNDFSSNITRTGATTYAFCAPPSTYAGGTVTTSLSAATSALFADTFAGMSYPQLGALGNAMAAQLKILGKVFKSSDEKVLQTLTIAEVTALTNLSPSQLENLDTLKLTKIDGLKDLSAAQVKAIQELDPDALKSLTAIDLTSISVLSSLSDATFAKIATFDPASVSTYTSAVQKSSNAPVDFLLTGSIVDSYGSTNSCISHVSSGTNQCRFFGAGYPNVTEDMTLYVNYYGDIFTQNFNFSPAAPNWEVMAVANDPFDVTACPADARCFAMEWGGSSRTPFVTVEPANSPSCQPMVATRINLGCFAFHTKIRMADGSDQEVHALKVGDMVYNPLRKAPARIKRTTLGPEKNPMVVVSAGLDRLVITGKHPMLTPGGIKPASQLQVGDSIRNGGGTWLRIDKLGHEAARNSVVNIELDTPSSASDDHAVLADGLVTGDLYLQEQMAAMPFGS